MPCSAVLHPRLQPLSRLGSALHALCALHASPHSHLLRGELAHPRSAGHRPPDMLLRCRWWGVPPVLTEWNIGRCHMGTENLLLGVWQTLGVSIDWSLVLHVYGGVNDQEFNGENGIVDAYGFATLTDVAAWQNQQLAAAIAATPSTTYTVDTAPQRFLAASEQVCWWLLV